METSRHALLAALTAAGIDARVFIVQPASCDAAPRLGIECVDTARVHHEILEDGTWRGTEVVFLRGDGSDPALVVNLFDSIRAFTTTQPAPIAHAVSYDVLAYAGPMNANREFTPGFLAELRGLGVAAIDVREDGLVWLRPAADVPRTTLIARVYAKAVPILLHTTTNDFMRDRSVPDCWPWVPRDLVARVGGDRVRASLHGAGFGASGYKACVRNVSVFFVTHRDAEAAMEWLLSAFTLFRVESREE